MCTTGQPNVYCRPQRQWAWTSGATTTERFVHRRRIVCHSNCHASVGTTDHKAKYYNFDVKYLANINVTRKKSRIIAFSTPRPATTYKNHDSATQKTDTNSQNNETLNCATGSHRRRLNRQFCFGWRFWGDSGPKTFKILI